MASRFTGTHLSFFIYSSPSQEEEEEQQQQQIMSPTSVLHASFFSSREQQLGLHLLLSMLPKS